MLQLSHYLTDSTTTNVNFQKPLLVPFPSYYELLPKHSLISSRGRKDYDKFVAGYSRIVNKELNFKMSKIPPIYLPFNTRFDYDFAKEFEHQWAKENGDRDADDPIVNLWEGVSMLGYGLRDHGASIIITIFLLAYILVALSFKDTILQPNCLPWGTNKIQEWEFRAQPKFIPAVQSDSRTQHEFLKLFRVMKRIDNEDKSLSDSDENVEAGFMDQFSRELSHVNEMCPRDAFFYSFAPRHNEAVMTLQRLFVDQRTVADLVRAAKNILISKRVNPKVWYLALLAASLERTDMIGVVVPHPLDAMPDLFVAGHLIQYQDERLRNNFNISSKNSKVTKPFQKTKNNSETSSLKRKKKASKPKSRPVRSTLLNTTVHTPLNKYKIQKSKWTRISRIKDSYKDLTTSSRHKKKQRKGKKCIVMDKFIGEDNGIENVLWYFREDMMLNQHHLYWHQYHPLNAARQGDRRAELFFYMHRAMLARYNAERLSNGLDRTYEQKLEHGAVLIEGYHSHLADLNSGKFWTPRPPFTPIVDIIHEHDPDFLKNITINQLLTLTQRLLKGIETGKLLSKAGGYYPIKNKSGIGINPLGDTLEASELSVNPLYYDAFGLHNLGHQLIGLSRDPEFINQVPTGIMSDAAVSMRDPSFYTYHTFIDNLFERFKETLPPYQTTGGAFPLLWNGVEIISTELVSNDGNTINEIQTFYTVKRFELTGGVDGSVDKGEEVDVCSKHLNHQHFMFRIVIDRNPCAKSKSGIGSVRIMMAPRFDEDMKRLPLVEQRRLMFPLDSFQVDLNVGRNIITRRAEDSSLTVPWSKSLQQLESGSESGAADYCGCGWPRHLYIPKGNEEGMIFDLFIMVTNFDHDFVPDDPRDLEVQEGCNSAYIFCGRQRRRYPDSKPMGYPFDRLIFKDCPLADIACKLGRNTRPIANLEEFVAPISNMAMVSFAVRHVDKEE